MMEAEGTDQGEDYLRKFYSEHPPTNMEGFNLFQALAVAGTGMRVYSEARSNAPDIERKMLNHFTGARMDSVRNSPFITFPDLLTNRAISKGDLRERPRPRNAVITTEIAKLTAEKASKGLTPTEEEIDDIVNPLLTGKNLLADFKSLRKEIENIIGPAHLSSLTKTTKIIPSGQQYTDHITQIRQKTWIEKEGVRILNLKNSREKAAATALAAGKSAAPQQKASTEIQPMSKSFMPPSLVIWILYGDISNNRDALFCCDTAGVAKLKSSPGTDGILALPTSDGKSGTKGGKFSRAGQRETASLDKKGPPSKSNGIPLDIHRLTFYDTFSPIHPLTQCLISSPTPTRYQGNHRHSYRQNGRIHDNNSYV